MSNDSTESAITLPRALVRAARELLVLEGPAGRPDLWLWEHARRVVSTAQMLALLPEARVIGEDPADLQALAAAALFADAGWAMQVREGQVDHWQVLSRPTNDIQREYGAGALQERAAGLLPDETIDRAMHAIRECNDRYTQLPEARALAEAENLDEIGIMYVLRQFRHFQTEGRPTEQLVINWKRQVEYRYWEARINDCLRWETTRHIARERLKAVERFMNVLARDCHGDDLRKALEVAGVDPGQVFVLPEA